MLEKEPSMAVSCSNSEMTKVALEISKKLNLPNTTSPEQFPTILMIHPTHVELVDTSGKTKPFIIDFNGAALTYRRLHGGGLGQAVCRAIGVKHNHKPAVIDATAGLGRDGFILAAMGCTVTLFERNPILQILLADGLKRGLVHENTRDICECIQFIPQDIQTYTEQLKADVLYLDPMYPHRKKSSLVKKEMRIIRQLVGDDPDADKLLLFGLQTGIKRVVVKRPKNAPHLGNKKPTHSLKEKNSRFDIYLQP